MEFRKPATYSSDTSWLTDGGLVRLEEGGVYDIESHKRDTNEMKDELAAQGGDSPFTFSGPVPQTGSSPRALSESSDFQKSIEKKVRDFMNKGLDRKEITARIASPYPESSKSKILKAAAKQMSLYGSVGRFILDARGYPSCAEAAKSISRNPHKRHIAYIMGCKCGCVKPMFVRDKKNTGYSDSLSAVLSEETEKDHVVNVPVCRSTGMVVISGAGDIDESWAGDTMIDMMNASMVDPKKVEKRVAGCKTAYSRLKTAFVLIEEEQKSLSEDTPVVDEQAEIFVPAGMSLDVSSSGGLLDVGFSDSRKKGMEVGRFIDPSVNELENERLLDYSDGFSVDIAEESKELALQTGTLPPDLEIEESEVIDIIQKPKDIGLVIVKEEKKEEPLPVSPGVGIGFDFSPDEDDLDVSMIPASLSDI